MGFTATKKIGNAVKRNRAKRRIRAIFYDNSQNLQDGTYIFVAKHSLIESTHEKLKNDFKQIVKRSKALKEIIND